MADRFASQGYSLKNKLSDRMIKQLLNLVITKINIVICQCLADLLTTDTSQYFAQPRPIIVNYYAFHKDKKSLKIKI